MAEITFMGAGSTVFVRNVIGDCMLKESLRDSHVALYDINAQRLKESAFILGAMNDKFNEGRMKITTHLGVRNRKAAMLDPHTATELSIDDIVKMCDELIDAHGDMLPKYI